jgi:hypothetical protein
MSNPSNRPHRPWLVQLPDGRWEVRCGECLQPTPIGIGLPVTNRLEAERIFANHAGIGASVNAA